MLDTFATRPDALYTVTYDRDGGGPIPAEQVQTTAPHPFYVSNRDGDGDGLPGGFVAASDLRAKDALALADGSSAEVVGLTVERADASEAFTTYNFAVADFHTYFVNADGVWVHNNGRECDRAFSVYQRLKGKLGLSNEEAYARLKSKLPNASRETLSKSFVEAYNTSPNKGPGTWVERARSFNHDVNARYQAKVTGAPVDVTGAVEYAIDDVNFDGLVSGKLVEAKGRYSKFINSAGELQPWIRHEFVNQAERQLTVAKAQGLPLEWHMMDQAVADKMRAIFQAEGLGEIVVRHVPLQ